MNLTISAISVIGWLAVTLAVSLIIIPLLESFGNGKSISLNLSVCPKKRTPQAGSKNECKQVFDGDLAPWTFASNTQLELVLAGHPFTKRNELISRPRSRHVIEDHEVRRLDDKVRKNRKNGAVLLIQFSTQVRNYVI